VRVVPDATTASAIRFLRAFGLVIEASHVAQELGGHGLAFGVDRPDGPEAAQGRSSGGRLELAWSPAGDEQAQGSSWSVSTRFYDLGEPVSIEAPVNAPEWVPPPDATR
jgi:hypothetical protein